MPRILSAAGENGWRMCWFVFGGATVVLALCSFLLLRNRPSEKGLLPCGADSDYKEQVSSPGGLAWGSVYRAGIVWHLGLVYVAFGFSYIIYLTFFVKSLIAEGGYTTEAAGNLSFRYRPGGWAEHCRSHG